MLVNHIVFYPDTEVVSIIASLTNLILHCEKLGFSYRQMSRTFFLLIQNHYPSLLDTAQHFAGMDRTLDLFKLLVDNIDLNAERDKIEQVRLSTVRKPGQNISETAKKLSSVFQQYLKITNGGKIKQEEVEKSAKGLALNDLMNFISEKCKNKILRWSNDKQLSGQPVHLDQAVKMIQRYEIDPSNQIYTTMRNSPTLSTLTMTTAATANWSSDVNNISVERDDFTCPDSPKSFELARQQKSNT